MAEHETQAGTTEETTNPVVYSALQSEFVEYVRDHVWLPKPPNVKLRMMDRKHDPSGRLGVYDIVDPGLLISRVLFLRTFTAELRDNEVYSRISYLDKDDKFVYELALWDVDLEHDSHQDTFTEVFGDDGLQEQYLDDGLVRDRLDQLHILEAAGRLVRAELDPPALQHLMEAQPNYQVLT